MLANQITHINSEILNVLKHSLYPGCTDTEAMLILSYCKAKKIDPILKPVHLVPMSVKTGEKDSQGKDLYEWRKVIMPGIGSYRIDAARTGNYVGMNEPEFGEDVTEVIGNRKLTYPKWCKITVKKMVNGQVFEFSAKEFWKENYATKSKSDISPNSMWEKRPYGQISKCAEAQALRKAFPDTIGCEYTKEEMEGKHFLEENKSRNKIETSKSILIESKGTVNDEVNMEEFENWMKSIKTSKDINELKEVFNVACRLPLAKDKELLTQLIDAKDQRKHELIMNDDVPQLEEGLIE